jgi:hypothetical protein
MRQLTSPLERSSVAVEPVDDVVDAELPLAGVVGGEVDDDVEGEVFPQLGWYVETGEVGQYGPGQGGWGEDRSSDNAVRLGVVDCRDRSHFSGRFVAGEHVVEFGAGRPGYDHRQMSPNRGYR